MRKGSYPIWSGQAIASANSDKIDTNQIFSISFIANFSVNDAAGTLKVQASNDPCNDQYQPGTTTPTTWVDVPNATAAVSAGAPVQIIIPQLCYRWVRLVWTRSAGTGTFTVNVFQLGV